jgi:hypothetical protein
MQVCEQSARQIRLQLCNQLFCYFRSQIKQHLLAQQRRDDCSDHIGEKVRQIAPQVFRKRLNDVIRGCRSRVSPHLLRECVFIVVRHFLKDSVKNWGLEKLHETIDNVI